MRTHGAYFSLVLNQNVRGLHRMDIALLSSVGIFIRWLTTFTRTCFSGRGDPELTCGNPSFLQDKLLMPTSVEGCASPAWGPQDQLRVAGNLRAFATKQRSVVRCRSILQLEQP